MLNIKSLQRSHVFWFSSRKGDGCEQKCFKKSTERDERARSLNGRRQAVGCSKPSRLTLERPCHQVLGAALPVYSDKRYERNITKTY
jgi:hypothetical protein